MTPRTLRDALLDRIDLRPGMRVLDPSVGTGEFLRSVLDREPRAVCFGWDVDDVAIRYASRLVPEAHLEVRSALDPYPSELERFDLVIGNPPYFQFSPSKSMREHFGQVISGRPNIFAMFFQAGLTALAPTGKLAYVVPPSMNNGAYFDALRDYITRTASLSWLRVYSDGQLFDGAQTAVQLVVVDGCVAPSRHVFQREVPAVGFRRTIFAERPELLEQEFEGRPTLYDLGYEAVTGTVVWNQHKDQLSNEREAGYVPLLWAQNIVNGQVLLHASPKRPQYVKTSRSIRGPAIIVNRIVGAVGAGVMRCALVDNGMEFVGENHVNVVRQRRAVPPATTWSGLLDLMSHPSVGPRVVLLTGNTQISATELTHLLPLGP